MGTMIKKDNTYIEATTEAVNKILSIANGQSMFISASGLANNEVIDIQVWQGNQYVSSGELLTATQVAGILDGPGDYRLAKSATASPAGVYVTG